MGWDKFHKWTCKTPRERLQTHALYTIMFDSKLCSFFTYPSTVSRTHMAHAAQPGLYLTTVRMLLWQYLQTVAVGVSPNAITICCACGWTTITWGASFLMTCWCTITATVKKINNCLKFSHKTMKNTIYGTVKLMSDIFYPFR